MPAFTRNKIALGFVTPFVLFSLAGQFADGQFGTGEISGVVTDPSAAAVAQAEVKVRNEANGQAKALVTDDQGRYTVLDLLAGSYTLEVNARGFKSYVRTGVVLITGSHVAVNVSLELGSVTETVEVAAAAAQVEMLSAG